MNIKNSVLDNATLAYDEVGAETEVIVDASPVGLGAMLTEKKRDGHRPVTHISGSPSPVEQRYSQTEREALAIRWACERLRVYLAGPRFKVVTDHKPLEAIFSNSKSKPPGRIARWSMYLQMLYVPSTSRLNTDQGWTTQQTTCQDTQYVHQRIRLTTRSRSRRRML